MNKKVIHSVFEGIVSQRGENVAVKTRTGDLISYKRLNSIANKISCLLVARNIAKGDIITVLFDNGLNQLASLLGVFKSGAVYLPMSKKYKHNHWGELYNNIKPRTILTTEENLEFLQAYDSYYEYSIPEVIVLSIDAKEEIIFSCYKYIKGKYQKEKVQINLIDANPKLCVEGDDSAYIFFTSGSTGKPKAVLGNHKALSHFIHWETHELQITERDRIAQVTSFTFDASLRDVFVPLIIGGTICVAPNKVKDDFVSFYEWLCNENITLLHTVPSFLRFLTSNLNPDQVNQKLNCNLKHLLLAGEKLYKKDILTWRKLFGGHASFINLYGATESVLVKTFYRVPTEILEEMSDAICVGKPISNTSVLILNSKNKLCKINEVGDIYIKTPFLSKGYFNNEEQTKLKFVQNPLNLSKDIIYKTGDYGKYDTSRNIIVLGRKDSIVKIHGVRSDINYIEETILQFTKLKAVKCILFQKENLEAVLCCFYVSDKAIDNEIREHCLKHLSQYEIPSFFKHFNALPVNINGKIDTVVLEEEIRKFLLIENNYQAPTSKIEQLLVQIWEEVLRTDNIGITDNFFALGGQSLMVVKMINKINKDLGYQIEMEDVFHNPTISELSKKLKVSKYQGIPKTLVQEDYPVTSSQMRLWMLSQFEEANLAYIITNTLEFKGDLELDKFLKALQIIINRYESLRTFFNLNEEGILRQQILPNESVIFDIEYTDNNDASKEKVIDQKNISPFDLAKAPLFKVEVVKIANKEYLIFFNLHHIICDGWSLEILSSEVIKIYNDLVKGNEIDLPELTIQNKDYAVWLESDFKLRQLQRSKTFWMDQLKGNLPILDLPSGRTRPVIKTYNGSSYKYSFSKETSKNFKAFIKNNEASMFMGLMASVNGLLYRYTNTKDIIIGTPVAGREHPDLENQIGLLLNTLPIRTQLDGSMGYKDVLALQKNILLDVYKHQSYPFDDLVDSLNVKRDISRSAIFDVMLVLHNQQDLFKSGIVPIQDATVKSYDKKVNNTQFDIDFSFIETEDCINVDIEYNTDIYDENFIALFISHLERFINQGIEKPLLPIDSIDYLHDFEKNKLLKEFNSTSVPFDEQKTYIDLFREQLQMYPDKQAIIGDDESFSYSEVEQLSNQLAHYLDLQCSIKQEELIGVKLSRDPWLPICILALFKLGGVYVPIDPSYPEERITYITANSGCSHIIDEQFISSFRQERSNLPIDFKPKSVSGMDLAYVIYTSGSTGKPKGVMIEHLGMLNHMYAMIDELEMTNNSVLVQNASSAFDISVWQLLTGLIVGCTTGVYSKATVMDPQKFLTRIQKEKTTILQVVPSYLQMLLQFESDLGIQFMNSLTYLLVTGEAVSKVLLSQWFERYKHIKVVNAYGPAEASDDVTLHIMDKLPKSNCIPVGKPIQNIQVYILNEQLQLCNIGVTGEIYISGVGVGRGYLHDKEKTVKKFIKDPFSKQPMRMYKTGDMARWLDDGTIDFVGRNDEQIKIRGHRIELGEIENHVLSIKGVETGVVIAKEYKDGSKKLITFYTGSDDIKGSTIKDELTKVLPDYMVPNFYIHLPELPLSPNGKIDKKSLPIPENLDKQSNNSYVKPSNEIEEKLVAIWEQVLDQKNIGVKDDFFDLGGHSIKAVLMLSKVNKQFSLNIDFTSVFELRCISSLAKEIANNLWDRQQLETNQIIDIKTI